MEVVRNAESPLFEIEIEIKSTTQSLCEPNRIGLLQFPELQIFRGLSYLI